MSPPGFDGRLSPGADAEDTIRIALYGEVNMNLIDGSSVWLQSMAQMLTSLPSVEVTLQLRFTEERDVLTAPLHAQPRIELVDPAAGSDPRSRLSPAEAIEALQRLDAERPFDVVFLRGAGVCEEAAASSAFQGRLWTYYLSPHEPRSGEQVEHVRRLTSASERVLCQTEPLRALAEAAAPEHAQKLTLLPPMIPAPAKGALRSGTAGPLRLLYAGKFAPEYYFLEMVETFRRLRRSHPEATLHLVGDKVHNPPDDPAFKPAAEAALAGTENLIWHGGVTREQVGELLREADIALSVRHPMMSRSKELSTKVLEYGSAGCAVLLNRTHLYEELLGLDYPLFANDPDTALAALLRAQDDPALCEQAAARCEAAARAFTFERVATDLEPHLRRVAGGGRAVPVTSERSRLVIAGHDFKFLGKIPDRARAAGAEVREDRWAGHNEPSAETPELLEWAEVALCEWCLGNAVWYSRNVRDDQRLVIRFHRVERMTDYPASVEIDQVDRVVFVGPHLREESIQRYSWPEEKLVVVPNAVDVGVLRREKLPESSFNLGMVGFVPAIKRLDRVLDLLELLRSRDRRFRLLIKGQPPWAFPWIRKRDDERQFFQQAYERIESAPLLRGAVAFEDFGPNVPAFLRKVGMIVSMSDWEGHQVALAEGMASGCLPVIVDRPGAREQYPDRWIHSSPEEAASAVLNLVESGNLDAEQTQAADFAERWSVEEIMPLWDDLLGLNTPASAVSVGSTGPAT